MSISIVTNEDNKMLLNRYPDHFFDLAIVDPPYGIKATWSKSRMDTFYKKGKLHQYQNEAIPDREYFELLKAKSKNQIIWGGNYYTEYLPPTNSWIVWNKLRNADITFMSEGELAHTSFKSVLRVYEFLWDGARKCEQVERIHPHQKPVKLYKKTLLDFAKAGDKILDTHVGSGSARIAAFDLGFDFYGCDSDPEYFRAQEKRFHNHLKQYSFLQQNIKVEFKQSQIILTL